MVWPIGQIGEAKEVALRSRELWGEAAAAFGFWSDPCGSIHLAHADDERQVLEEYAALDPSAEFLEPEEAVSEYPWINRKDFAGAMRSKTEMCVFPPEAVASVTEGLIRRHGVDFQFHSGVASVEDGVLRTGRDTIEFDHAFVCTGQDTQLLFPHLYDASQVVRCRLQMMRTSPMPRMGIMAAGGLTLAHYENFSPCPTLPALKERFRRDYADETTNGIHVLVSQHGDSRLTLGDSHHYGNNVSPFSQEWIDLLILRYLNRMVEFQVEIVERWMGVYLKRRDGAWLLDHPQESVTILNGLGGAGMTLSFGLAERVVEETLG
jgi:FAD dependent oxidoreductase TIGR03364